MSTKLVFSDIDGTLLTNDHVVGDLTCHEIKRIISAGIPFIPVSARMPEAIKKIMNDISVESPIVSYNGALIQDESGKIISSSPMSVDTAVDICNYVEKNMPSTTWNVYSGHEWFSQKSNDRSKVDLEESIVKVKSIDSTISDIKNLNSVHKLLLMGSVEQITYQEEKLKKIFPQLSISKSSPAFMEIMSKGVGKDFAVKFLAKYYKVATEDTMAFGDNFNDLEMLKAVGIGYVMENAPEKMKEEIQNIAPSNNDDGIGQILQKIK